MASPSAPTCVVTATRSRVFKNSAISPTVLFVVRVVIGPYLPQSGFYPRRPLHNWVRLEAQPGRALEARLRPYRGLYTSSCALQTLVGGLGILPGEDTVEDRRTGQVGADADARNRYQALNPRVRERGDRFARDLPKLRLHLARALAHS